LVAPVVNILAASDKLAIAIWICCKECNCGHSWHQLAPENIK